LVSTKPLAVHAAALFTIFHHLLQIRCLDGKVNGDEDTDRQVQHGVSLTFGCSVLASPDSPSASPSASPASPSASLWLMVDDSIAGFTASLHAVAHGTQKASKRLLKANLARTLPTPAFRFSFQAFEPIKKPR
jgi:hypothetical protein